MKDVLVVFIVFGGVGFVAALVAALVFARTRASAAAVALAGPLLVAAYLLERRLDPPDQPLHHEARYFGIALDPLMWVTLAFNLVGWLAGTAAGTAWRRGGRHLRSQALRSS